MLYSSLLALIVVLLPTKIFFSLLFNGKQLEPQAFVRRLYIAEACKLIFLAFMLALAFQFNWLNLPWFFFVFILAQIGSIFYAFLRFKCGGKPNRVY